jgi:predicted Fe-S protein YdhL (DUF1289 family)
MNPATKFPHASESFKARNPALFGLGQLPNPVAQSNPVHEPAPADGRKEKGPFRMAGGGIVLRVTLVSHRRREADDDNLTAGCKHLRDAIANWFGLDDSQRVIAWQYGQVLTKGREGTSVMVETNNLTPKVTQVTLH